MSNNGFVKVHNENGVAKITFFNEKKNSLPGSLLNEISEVITSASENNDHKVIVLQSEGNGPFCAGASFDELTSISDEKAGLEFFSGFSKVILAIKKSRLIVIGKIQGKAVGGGVGVAAACDYTIAAPNASIKLSELDVGIGPFVVGPAVERKIGTSAYQAITLDTEWKSAKWALEKGLFSKMVELDELDKEVYRFASQLAGKNPLALQELKETFWQGTESWETLLVDRAKISGKLVLSDYTRSAIAKFKKR